jgi:hypothetical protein
MPTGGWFFVLEHTGVNYQFYSPLFDSQAHGGDQLASACDSCFIGIIGGCSDLRSNRWDNAVIEYTLELAVEDSVKY